MATTVRALNYWERRGFINARGVLYHSPRIDPGVRYPPYSEHQRKRSNLGCDEASMPTVTADSVTARSVVVVGGGNSGVGFGVTYTSH